MIGRHSHGYVALYRYVPEIDTPVFSAGARSPPEAGYTERDPAGPAVATVSSKLKSDGARRLRAR